jgi:dienelactone hydrolase
MEILEESEQDGVRACRFDLVVDGETVPGMHWLPVSATGAHATVCIGHGGFQHKLYGNVPELAIQLVQNLGVGVVALDAPLHGDRQADPEAAEEARAALVRSASRPGGRRQVDPEILAGMAERARKHVIEWRALLDALQQDARWADGPFGWWGVSMGTSHGIPLVAGDERFRAAVFGLNALAPGNEEMAAQAKSITIPILFLNQSDDELMTRDAALALWDAFGSTEKTMHINPGGHVQVPRFERHSSEAFFRRHLLGG